MKKNVIIIGGGVAGMQAAITLDELGLQPVILEREPNLGGKLLRWDRLFPSLTPAEEVLKTLSDQLARSSARVLTATNVKEIGEDGRTVTLADDSRLEADAVVVASGFELFDARLKEEYGYGLYENVYTSVDLETMFRKGEVLTSRGERPRTVAFLHCVGSRDEKVNQRHCSRVCCITGVKQAIEVKRMLPQSEVYSFYMDMRMFGPGYEEMYRQAQQEYNIHFVRGRISEAGETIDKKVQIKAEDTLIGRPLKMSVDMLFLLVGMKAGASNPAFARNNAISLYPSGFIKPEDQFTGNVLSGASRIFYAGTATAPKNIGESINEGVTAAYKVARALQNET